MGGRVFVIGLAGLVLVLLSATLGFTQDSQSWQKEWEKVVAAAEKEGQVNIAGPPGDAFRDALTAVFNKAYPKMKVELLGGSGRDKVARILRERQAGLYNWDIYISGPTSALAAFKPVGAFEPFKPTLILPEVRNDSHWVGGHDAGWADLEKKLYYVFGGTVASDNIYVNWDVVQPGEIKSALDLLNPKWAGKIAMQDPRIEGKGLNDILVFSLAYGEEFVKKLLRDQKVVYTNDRRQLVEWVVRGRYPVSVGLNEYFLVLFQEKGVGKNVTDVKDPKTALYWSSGSSGIGLFNRAPHPNAARLYINWLFSKEGQVEWTKTQTNSRRIDVPPYDPKTVMKPGQTYHNTQAEDMIPQRRRIQELAGELIR
jgi:iron(III) transport system substrate-binding protein